MRTSERIEQLDERIRKLEKEVAALKAGSNKAEKAETAKAKKTAGK